MRIILSIVVLMLFAPESEACTRRGCGLFGRFCKFQQQAVVVKQQHYVAPYVKQPEIFVVQNNYPQPIGQYAYAQQGNTGYGYQASAQAFYSNPNEFVRQAYELSKASLATASLGFTGHNQAVQSVLALNSQYIDTVARGDAASKVLVAAGFSGSAALQQRTSQTLRITYNQTGEPSVEVLPEAPPQAIPEANEHSVPAKKQPTRSSNSVLGTICAKCHGVHLQEPKKGKYFDESHPINCKDFKNALSQVRLGKMPPPETENPLTPDQKGRLFDELMELPELE